MKKTLVLLLTLAMLASMVVSASAATITIEDAPKGETYNAYKLLTFEKGQGGAIQYIATNAWLGFFEASPLFNVQPSGGINYVVAASDELDGAAVAAAAKAWAADSANNISADATAIAGDNGAELTVDDTGYYLIDTTMGTMLFIEHSDDSPVINEKNTKPSIDKKVADADEEFDDSNIAAIGDTVNYELKVTVGKGAVKYIVKDDLSAGLTLDKDTIKIDGASITDAVATIAYDVVDDVDDTVTYDFVITFADTYLAGKTEASVITITYDATINGNALIAAANPNTAILNWGNAPQSEETVVNTYVYDLGYIKTNKETTDLTEARANLLAGAEFQLFGSAAGNDRIYVELVAGNVYKVTTTPNDVNMVGTEVIIQGLDAAKTYYLDEVVVPAGYNKPSGRFAAECNETTAYAIIANKTGAELPETGGAGTVAFTVVGSLLMLAAVVLFTAKKKMSVQG